ncbi:MAG: cyclodeaminase/cyclohydrolase family protein [Phycisphaerae bacterium]
MEELTQQRFEDLLNSIAARTPTPGGGAVAASAGALACAMGRMVVAYSANAKTSDAHRALMQKVLDTLRQVDELLRSLISLDAETYRTMTVVAKELGKSSADYQDAVLAAIAVPMKIVNATSQAVDTLDDFKPLASRFLLSDLGVSAVLAEAAARAAAYSVRVNLPELTDAARSTKLRQELTAVLDRCVARRDAITGFVDAALQP